MLKTESRMFICLICIYKHDAISDTPVVLLHLKESTQFSCLTTFFFFFFFFVKYKMQAAFQITFNRFLLPLLEGVQKRINTKNFRFFLQYGRYNKSVRKRFVTNFMTPFRKTHFNFYQTSFGYSVVCFFFFFFFFFCLFVFCCCFFFPFIIMFFQ